MTMGELAAMLQAEKLINWFRNKGDTSPVFLLPRPWADADAATPEEYAAAEIELLSRSAFAPE